MDIRDFGGWIKLYRELLDKPIWKLSTKEQKVILITLLLMASHRVNEWEWACQKFEVKPGQFVTSLKSIKKEIGNDISIQNIRTALVRFEKLEFLTNQSTKHGRLISIINWDSYQDIKNMPNIPPNKALTKHQQSTNTYQECKNVKNERKEKKKCAKFNSHFELFWNAFADKRGKKPAYEKAWKKIPDMTEELALKIIEGARRYAKQRKDILVRGGTPKMAQGWLTDRRWEDEDREATGGILRWNEDPDLENKA